MSTTISASLVKELRDATGAGMMDCKRALEETDGDLDAARTLLRERGMASAGKRAGRETTEGLVGYIVDGGVGSIVGVGCETEPVSKNDEFQAFAINVLRGVHADGPAAVGGVRGRAHRAHREARREHRRSSAPSASRHRTGTSRALRAPAGEQDRRARRARGRLGGARAPARDAHLVRGARVDDAGRRARPRSLAAERSIFANTDEVQSKPEAAREKIVDGMLNKRFFAATPGGALVEQAWIHEPSKTVGQALAEAGAAVARFVRISVAGS